MSSLKRGRPLKRQARELTWNVHQFMANEAQDAKKEQFNKERFQKVVDRTAQATRVSKRTITRILKEKQHADLISAEPSAGPSFRTPKKGRFKQKYRLKLDDFDYQIIRRKIYDFHLVEKQVVTIKSLLNKLKEDINFTGGRESLRKIIKELGFKFKKTESNRKLLAEKDEVRLLRIRYLRQVKIYRNEGRDIVYGDETYVHSTHTKERAWSDKSGKGLKKPISKGSRLIIVHAGGANGFVPNALLIYKSAQATGDYHSEMNKENYEKWLREHLIPNLQQNSVFVIDNASYHSTLEDRAPNSNSAKRTMQEWLTSKNIPFEARALKPELYNIINRHKHQYVKYSIDTIMEAHGHKVLRLPPYHPDFNPIENIWSQVKRHVSKHNVGMNLNEVKRLLTEKFSSIGRLEWRKVVDHAIKCEDEFLTLEEAIDDRLDQFIINTTDDSSTSPSSSYSASSNSDSSSDVYNSDTEMEGVHPLE